MGKDIILAIFFALTVSVSIYTLLNSEPRESHVCEVSETKTIAFLEGELGKAFSDSDHFRYQKDQYEYALKKCQSVTDEQLCKDRNLWMKRAHEGRNIPVPLKMEMDCSVF